MERDYVDQYANQSASEAKGVLVWLAFLFLHRPIIEFIASIFS
jgi:hypothetical protein